MAEIIGPGSDVPLGRLRRADDLVGRIEALIADAQAQGYDSIAYFLEMARTEASIQLDQGVDRKDLSA